MYIKNVLYLYLYLYHLTMTKTKTPVNVQIFVDHLQAGLDAAGLDFDDYNPMTVTNKETKEIGFLFCQQIDDIETSAIVFNDRVEFADHSVSLIMNNESPPTKIAILFLVAMIQGDFITPPNCPCCAEEVA